MQQQLPAMAGVLGQRRQRKLARTRRMRRRARNVGARHRAAHATIRSRISPAALRVNVIATMRSGRSTVASSARKRWIRSSVLPEPAGACTRNERVTSSARSRAAASRRAPTSVASFIASPGVLDVRPRADAAQRLSPALLAGRVDIARDHRRFPGAQFPWRGRQGIRSSAPRRRTNRADPRALDLRAASSRARHRHPRRGLAP